MSASAVTPRQRRKLDIAKRVRRASDAAERCKIVGCRQPTTASAARGLNRLYCRRHEDQHARHGSYFKLSYGATAINPYRRAALVWIQSSDALPGVLEALEGVRNLYRSAGAVSPAFRLAGKKPDERSRVALARLREAEIAPELLLAAWLAVQAMHLDDPQPERRPEYRIVQVAKIVHRMASGTHKRWAQQRANGETHVTELHKYPQSRGEVLRHIGRLIDTAADAMSQTILDGAMEAIRRSAKEAPMLRAQPRSMGRRRVSHG